MQVPWLFLTNKSALFQLGGSCLAKICLWNRVLLSLHKLKLKCFKIFQTGQTNFAAVWLAKDSQATKGQSGTYWLNDPKQ